MKKVPMKWKNFPDVACDSTESGLEKLGLRFAFKVIGTSSKNFNSFYDTLS